MADKVAVITGGASGIGAASARRLARDGYAIVIADVDLGSGEAMAKEIEATGGEAMALQLDVTDAQQSDAAAAKVWEAFGRCDVLMTSAGILENAASVMDMDMAAHDRLWQVNYNGTVLSCRAFGQRMKPQGAGSIVTVASICSLEAFPLPAYNPSKTAILRLTQILAVELGRHGIRVNAVAPTYTITPPFQARIDAGERDGEAVRNSGALDMYVKPEHIANVVGFLCSQDAAAVTGITLPVDAGWSSAISYKNYVGGMPWDRQR